MAQLSYEDFIRSRITELRLKRNVSEHKMSLELGKSGSYIRSITSGIALPSLKELFNIFEYLNIDPVEFFEPLQNKDTPYQQLCSKLQSVSEEDIKKVSIFLDWIKK